MAKTIHSGHLSRVNYRGRYLMALSSVMRKEYAAIATAGITVQIDCPDLAMGRHTIFQDATDDEFLRHANEQVDALNDALADVPADRLRMHWCWGNYEGPHYKDIPLQKKSLMWYSGPNRKRCFSKHRIHAMPMNGRCFAMHESPTTGYWHRVCVDSTSNFIEHPELVAQRIQLFTDIVGRERVIAASDCGFSAFAGAELVDGEVAFAELAALVEGAAISSRQLWR